MVSSVPRVMRLFHEEVLGISKETNNISPVCKTI